MYDTFKVEPSSVDQKQCQHFFFCIHFVPCVHPREGDSLLVTPHSADVLSAGMFHLFSGAKSFSLSNASCTVMIHSLSLFSFSCTLHLSIHQLWMEMPSMVSCHIQRQNTEYQTLFNDPAKPCLWSTFVMKLTIYQYLFEQHPYDITWQQLSYG